MKNFFLVTSLIFLIGLGVAAGWVIIDPAGVKQTFGLLEEEEAPVRQVAQATESTSRRDRRRPPANEVAQADGGTVDRKAQRRRPPTREEAEAQKESDVVDSSQYRRARYVGPMRQQSTQAPPPEELYPFSINKRTFPDSETVSVELLMQNRSGDYWKTAYVVLRPLEGKKAEMFEVSNWGIDETIALDYSFPKSETMERMSKLRVMGVTGEKREAALARKLSEQRQKGAALSQEMMISYNKESSFGGRIEAPGLLGMVAWATSPVTGLQIEITKMEDAEAPLKISFPDQQQIPEIHPVNMATDSAERTDALLRFEDAHKAAFEIEKTLREISDEMERLGYTQAVATTVPPMLAKVRRDLAEFNDSALRLATMARRSPDAEIKELDRLAGSYGGTLVDLMETMEKTVHNVDPTFRIQE